MKWAMVILSICLAAIGQILIKWGILHPNPLFSVAKKQLEVFVSLPVIVGLCFYTISALTWIVALKRVQLSIAYPMASIGYVIVIIAAYFMLGEPLTGKKLLGIALICAGVFFISRS